MGEEGHWYDRFTGKLITEVPYAPPRAGTRPPTLRDARKGGLAASVTGILGVVDKPGLRAWGIRHVAEVALRTLRRPDEQVSEWRDRVLDEHGKYAEDAAARGTEIHYAISTRLSNYEPGVDFTSDCQEVMEAFWPWYANSGLECQVAEHSFISPLGYAGTLDWLGTYQGRPAILDFKTQDFDVLVDNKATPGRPPYFYDEQGLQLSGYALGTGRQDHERISVIISRMVPGLIALHVWKPELVARYDRAFPLLWAYWQEVNDYRPTDVSKEQSLEWLQQNQQQLSQQSRMALGARGGSSSPISPTT